MKAARSVVRLSGCGARSAFLLHQTGGSTWRSRQQPLLSSCASVGAWREVGRRGYAAQRQLFVPSPQSFSELRSSATTVKKRIIRILALLTLVSSLVVVPVSTLAAQAWEQRHWPTLRAKVIEVVPIEGTNKRSVTYRYKVVGRVIQKTQVNWNVPWWDQVNKTELDYQPGDFVTIHHHPNNVTLSVLKPGRFAHPNFARLKGELLADVSGKTATE